MATSPTSKSATQSGAAKDDVVGLNGDYTFTIKDLLADDPGGAAKLANLDDSALLNKQFFFGDAATDQGTVGQAAYLAAHGITTDDWITFHVNSDARDFSYFVQIGNKGTWSKADVDVHAPQPPQDPYHLGAELASWTFEDNAVTDPRGYQIMNAPNGWFNVSDYAETNNLGSYAKTMEVVDGTTGPLTGWGAGEHQWLDTAASPGNIWIQLSEANRTTNLAADHEAKLLFSVAKQDLGDGGHTDPKAVVEFLWNYEVVKTVHASDLTEANKFYQFDTVVHGNDLLATDQLMIRSDGQETALQGLAIDHIVLQDWII